MVHAHRWLRKKGEQMELSQLHDLLEQVQAGARVSTAIGEPITVGERVVIPVVEVAYGGGGGGGGASGLAADAPAGSGGGGGGGIRVRPLGCWVIDADSEKWVPAVDTNRLMIMLGSITMLLLVTIRTLAKRR